VPGADPLPPAAARIAARKLEHLELALTAGSRAGTGPGWEDVHLVPRSLPGVSLDQVELTTRLLGRDLAAPLVIVPMTGGHPDAEELNAVLGEAAERLGLAVGVGSQRAALREPALAGTFAAVRRRAPGAFVIANLGACQLVRQGEEPPLGADALAAVVDMVGADALSIHLNVVQELVQPEGDRNTGDLAVGIARAVAASPVPVIVKETGAGMDRETAEELAALGVGALDVGGAGGTSFARIEAARARAAGAGTHLRRGEVFADWGVPTAASILETARVGIPVVATGGVATGLDAAKALALGATAVGVGRVAIEAAVQGVDALVQRLEGLLDELRTAMVLCGASTPAELSRRSPVLTGFTGEWARQRNLR
jgi:isopentenyl-diphosphate delta-isomerase